LALHPNAAQSGIARVHTIKGKHGYDRKRAAAPQYGASTLIAGVMDRQDTQQPSGQPKPVLAQMKSQN